MIESDTFTGVAYWASYLINGDSSGMGDSEIALCDAWHDSLSPWYVVGIVDDSERFTWSGKLYGADCDGVTVCDYIVHKQESAQ